MSPVIDAHHHLWRYNAEEFGWIGEPMAVLRRDFLPDDLAPELTAAGVDGTVVVQARQTLEETRWLCGIATQSAVIRGVVGWAPIGSHEFSGMIDTLAEMEKLVGLRHVVQDEPAGFLDGSEFNRGMSLLPNARLTFDILIHEGQVEEATRLVDRHPQQAFVLDHAAKPPIASGELEPWRSRLFELARRPHVLCKISGLVTEARWDDCNMNALRPYLDVCVEAFSMSRLMAGSDWPVCVVAKSYSDWWTLLRQYFVDFSADEQDAVFGGNAINFYKLKS